MEQVLIALIGAGVQLVTAGISLVQKSVTMSTEEGKAAMASYSTKLADLQGRLDAYNALTPAQIDAAQSDLKGLAARENNTP